MGKSIKSKPSDEELDKLVEKRFIKMIEENPAKIMMWALLQMGIAVVETNAATMKLKTEATIKSKRYEVVATIRTKEVKIHKNA